MRYELSNKKIMISQNDFYLLPTIRFFINSLIYLDKNFSIEFHFLSFHIRLLFVKK
jgi:hypothetical protein